jgi:hypothetical protein
LSDIQIGALFVVGFPFAMVALGGLIIAIMAKKFSK